MSDSFGETTEEQQAQRPTMSVPARPLNSVELELMEAKALDADGAAPIIWIDKDVNPETWNEQEFADTFGPVTLQEAKALQDIIFGEIEEKFRRQICIARELGADATLELYRVACEVEGVDPIT
jgi:hypothetical protein